MGLLGMVEPRMTGASSKQKNRAVLSSVPHYTRETKASTFWCCVHRSAWMIMVMHEDNLDKMSVDSEGTQKASHLHHAETVHIKIQRECLRPILSTFYLYQTFFLIHHWLSARMLSHCSLGAKQEAGVTDRVRKEMCVFDSNTTHHKPWWCSNIFTQHKHCLVLTSPLSASQCIFNSACDWLTWPNAWKGWQGTDKAATDGIS